MTNQSTIEDSFIKQLQAVWSAEKMLTEAMPGIIMKATNLGLKKNLAYHLAETDQHKVAIEAICKQLGYEHAGEENAEIKNMLAEGERSMTTQVTDSKMDAAIIMSAINIEHYEIAQYETLSQTAGEMGYEGIAQRLRLTLEEERQADAKLNYLHKTFVEQSSVLGAPGSALK